MAKQQVLNFVHEVIAGDATTPVEAQTWYDSTLQTVKFKANSVIKNVLDRSVHTGTQLAATISDFNTAVRTNRLDQMAAPTADVSMNSLKITNLADGASANDGVNFAQLQAVLNGRNFKDTVRAASTANIATLSGLLTQDGITPVAGDRILVKDQTTASLNGIYIAASGAWTRSTDADNTSPDSEIKTGMSVMVSEGTLYADKQFTLTTNGVITIGTTALVFAQTGSGTTYTQGTGISISGSVISLDTNVATRKAAGTIGDAAASTFTLTHSLNTLDIQIVVREISTGEQIIVPNKASSTSQCVVEFGYIIATNSHRVIVQG